MSNNKQTAVKWLENELAENLAKIILNKDHILIEKLFEQAKEMEKRQQDTLAVEFTEWYENDVLAKGDYEMIDKDKKELLQIFKETYEN